MVSESRKYLCWNYLAPYPEAEQSQCEPGFYVIGTFEKYIKYGHSRQSGNAQYGGVCREKSVWVCMFSEVLWWRNAGRELYQTGVRISL